MKSVVLLACLFGGAFAADNSATLSLKGDALGTSLRDFCRQYRRVVEGSVAPHVIFDADAACIVTARKTFPFEGPSKETIANVPVTSPIVFYFYAREEADWTLVTAPRREWSAAIKAHSDEMIAATRRRERPKSFGPPAQREWSDVEEKAAERMKLGAIEVQFASTRFAEVLAGLSERYGPCSGEMVVQMQNGFGATFPSRILTWDVSRSQSIEARERVGRLEHSQVRFCDSSIVRDAVRIDKQAREAAKDL